MSVLGFEPRSSGKAPVSLLDMLPTASDKGWYLPHDYIQLVQCVQSVQPNTLAEVSCLKISFKNLHIVSHILKCFSCLPG
jgi:hypothetical protein